MKQSKKLLKLAQTAVIGSFVEGRLREEKVLSFINSFKTLPRKDAITVLMEYQKGVKRELDQTTMVIETASPLSDVQVKSLTNALRSDFQINVVKTLINPVVLGGLKIRIGDTIFDDSLANRIEQLREEIRN